jgi:hypothetical protein
MIYKRKFHEDTNTYSIQIEENGIIKTFGEHKDNTDYQEYLKWTKASPMNVAEETE